MPQSKRKKEIISKVDSEKFYSIGDAVNLIKTMPTLKFKESIDISINLGIDINKSDQNVRGSSSLPHGIGKTARVVVFAEGDDVKAANDAGADKVGFEDLIEEIKKAKNLEADIVISSPECMKLLGQLGRILGPKSLMPNPKEGTVTKNIGQAVAKAKKGQIRYKTDKAGIVHTTVGKIDFKPNQLIDNIHTLIDDLIKIKPSSIKGKYMKNITLSSTMGPGIRVDLSTVERR